MQKTQITICLFLISLAFHHLYSQIPFVEWSKCYGGTGSEFAGCIIQTSDTGCLLTGYTTSNDGDVTGFHGLADAWVVKTDKYGNIEWQKSLGGVLGESFSGAIETQNGDFLLVGKTESEDGDVSGHHGIAGVFDIWVVMLTKHGNLLWQKCYGGSDDDYAATVKLTNDNRFIIVGYTSSNDNDVTGNHGTSGTNAPFDVWALKIDSTGSILWQKCYGGTDAEYGKDVIECTNGDFVIASTTYSNDGDVSGNHGAEDWWVFKIDSIGNIKWQKCLGGTEQDYIAALCESKDGGYVVTGQSRSHDGDVTGIHKDSSLTYYNDDFLTIKLDSLGNKLWQKCYGGNYSEASYDITITEDDHQIIVGEVGSWDGDVTGYMNIPLPDYWIVCIDSTSGITWQKCMGGQAFDFPRSVIKTLDGGLIILGESNSVNGDVTTNHSSLYDLWVIKLGYDSSFLSIQPFQPNQSPTLFPNPFTTQLTFSLTNNEQTTVSLYNLFGQQILRQTFTNSTTLNTEQLISGIYFYELRNHKGVVKTGKVVRE